MVLKIVWDVSNNKAICQCPKNSVFPANSEKCSKSIGRTVGRSVGRSVGRLVGQSVGWAVGGSGGRGVEWSNNVYPPIIPSTVGAHILDVLIMFLMRLTIFDELRRI